MIKKYVITALIIMQLPILAPAYTEDNLDSIEMAKYGRVYSTENLANRLRRLETDYFGMAQSGDIDKRISMLQQIAVNERMPYYPDINDEYFYLSKKPNALQRFFNNVSSVFYSPGVVTGYTPNMYNPNWNNEYMNFMNSRNSYYCPYHDTYHRGINNRFRSRYYGNYRNRYGNSYGYNFNNPYSRGYIPTDALTNVATRSTVHILQD